MKTSLSSFLILILATQFSSAQNIGIGNTAPLTKLDINGDIAFRSADITITTVYNYALDVNTVKQAYYKLKSPILPIGNFILAGITAGTDGRMITLTNYSGVSMEIYNEDLSANANDRIKTGIGTTLAVFANGSVTLQYDVPEQRWLVKGGHNNSLSYFGGGGGTSYWGLSGNNINNTNSGNVGIGIANPLFKVDISGDQRIVGTAINSPGSGGGLTSGGVMRIENTANSYSLKIDGGMLQCEKPRTNGISGTSASILAINPYGGNVGIGTTDPGIYKLAVKGKIRSEEIVVETGWADYVFAEEYQLASLESVEKHIMENKHLQGIPSAATIQNEGLNLGAVQTKMMEKIEELTLYIIQLNKEIELLKSKK